MKSMGRLPLGATAIVSLAPMLLQADATIRYKMESSGAFAAGAALNGSSVIYMKGDKGAIAANGTITIADFTRQEITLVDTAQKKFATIAASEYGSRMSAGFAQAGAAGDMMKSMESSCEGNSTGHTETIQGVRAEEHQVVCSIGIAAVPGAAVKFTMNAAFARTDPRGF